MKVKLLLVIFKIVGFFCGIFDKSPNIFTFFKMNFIFITISYRNSIKIFGGILCIIIETKRYKDGSISVRDYGRGVPLDYNEAEKRYNWDLIYCELYACGKNHKKNQPYN